MDYKIIDIFPTAVLKFKLGRDLTKSEIDFVEYNENKHLQNSGNKYSKNTFILNENEMQNIFEFCNNSIQTYFDKIINPISKTNIKITQSWLNYTNKGEYHHTHSHSNSIISGVFYINAKKEYDSILMQRGGHNAFVIFPNSVNDFITNEVDFKVETGELILFPSEVYHRVDVTKGEHQRISLAFNTFFEGELGYEPSLNYLKL